MYGLCVSFASAGGKMPHAPPKRVPELDIFRYFSAFSTWCRQFDIDENETNCVNYKYCLVDVTGVSDSCID